MRWAHLITPMCQILNVVITSCVSFVLVYIVFFFFFSFFLNYLMGCHRRISRRGPDRLRPNEMNLFAPNLRRRAAHLGGTVLRLLDNINTSSSGVEASRF